MRKYLSLITILLFLMVLSGCGLLVTALLQAILGTHAAFVFIPAAIAAKDNGAKYGIIILSQNLPPEGYKPGQGAKVYVEGTTISATTDPNGFFKLTDVPAGIRSLKVEFPDFLPVEEKIVVTDPNVAASSFNTLKIIPEKVLMPIGIGGTIEFTAYGETEGTIPVLPPVTWEVVNDIGTIQQNGIFTATKAGTGIIVAINGSKRAEVSVTVVEKVGTIKGHVSYNGKSVTDAQIKVNDTYQYTLTDSSGNYILPGVPAATVTVTVTSSSTGKKGSLTVTVPAGGTVTLDIDLGSITPVPESVTPTPSGTSVIPVGTIKGKILEYDGNTPVKNAYILFYSYIYPAEKNITARANPNTSTSSDSSGNYTFSNVPQGAGLIECWRSQSDYTSDPNRPFAKADVNVVSGTTVVDIKSLYAPTATPTPVNSPTPSGPSWRTNIKVNDVSGLAPGTMPRIATDSVGNACAIWSDRRNGNWDIYFSYKPAGGNWGVNVRVDDDSTGSDATSPDIAVDAAGNAYAVWVDNRTGKARIFYSERPAGLNWGTNSQVDFSNGSTFPDSSPSITVNSTGTPYVIWVDRRNTISVPPLAPNIYFSYYDLLSSSWTTNIQVDDKSSGTNVSSPDIGSDSMGNLYAVWADRRNGDDDIYGSYKPSGSPWGTNVRIVDDATGRNAFGPRLAVDLSGNAYVVWQDERNGIGSSNIYFSYTAARLWQPNKRVDDSPGIASTGFPDIGVDSAGNAYAVWPDRRNGNWDIYSSYKPAGGNWGANVRVNDSTGTTASTEASISSGSSGNPQAIWEDKRNGANDVYSSVRQ